MVDISLLVGNAGAFVTAAVNFCVTHKDALIAFGGGAVGLAVTAQVALHKLNPHLAPLSPERRKVYSYILAQGLTLIASIVAYLVTNVNLEILAPSLATAVTFVHRIFVSPYYTRRVLPFLEYEANRKDTAVTPGISAADAAPAGNWA